MATFHFIRHGETEWNALGRLCGRTDVPLSDVGRCQAQLVALRFKSMPVAALYSSPLRRALETAVVVGEAVGLAPVVDARLVELDYGAWEGRTYEEIEHVDPNVYLAWKHDPASTAPPAGESGEQLVARVAPFLTEVAQRHERGNVLVVCHRTVSRLVACHIMGVPLSQFRRRVPMDNAAFNVFETRAGKWSVLALNDTAHLGPVQPAAALQGE